jgi:hypothetical protein
VVAITNGKLDFGPWEADLLRESDGWRKKRVLGSRLSESSVESRVFRILAEWSMLQKESNDDDFGAQVRSGKRCRCPPWLRRHKLPQGQPTAG